MRHRVDFLNASNHHPARMNLIPQNALLEFAGCVLVVSHDRYFLDRVSLIVMNSGLLAWPGALMPRLEIVH
jgi:hypothetical protein